jgi:hypothetical protein
VNDTLGTIGEFLMEIFLLFGVSVLVNIILKPTFLCNFINPYIFIFGILVYISVHFINYGLYKINNVHQLHHEYINVNYGFDILDNIFNTKYCKENTFENLNHYIPNMLVAFIITIIIKQIYTNLSNNCKSSVKEYLLMLYLLIGFVMMIISFIIVNKPNYKKINDIFQKNMNIDTIQETEQNTKKKRFCIGKNKYKQIDTIANIIVGSSVFIVVLQQTIQMIKLTE